MKRLCNLIVLIKGAGEVASGVAHRLHCANFKVILTEIASPLAVSRGTSFCEAVWDGTKTIEGITAENVPAKLKNIRKAWRNSIIPLVVDPEALVRFTVKPDVIVDATMTKKKNSITINDARLVIGLGPGFNAGQNAHVVVETFQNNNLGKVINSGEALPDNGIPVEIGGLSRERVIWAACDGTFVSDKNIGDYVNKEEVIGFIGNQPVTAPLKGWLRGLLRSNVIIGKGDKLTEIDQVNDNSIAWDIRSKMRAIGGGVLEAIMMKYNI
ncbi:MAG: selenium-dependent molybdenum cofactor biosynthesis protein YqeB [Candidatus Humimicrobiaceae bacterium]